MNTKKLTLIGIMAAVTCILGPLSIVIPVSPVPISLTNFAIYLSVYILGPRLGLISYLIYMLIGLIGLPVFSGFSSGPGKLFGPTGGYLIGFIFMAYISGYVIEKWPSKKLPAFFGLLGGTAVCYFFGTVWLSWQANLGFASALAAGVLPFIPGDLIKILLAVILGPQLRSRLKKAGLL